MLWSTGSPRLKHDLVTEQLQSATNSPFENLVPQDCREEGQARGILPRDKTGS